MGSLGLDVLTHSPLDKMAAISQTTFSYVFSWMKSNAIIWTNADPIYWHIDAALGGDEFKLNAYMSSETLCGMGPWSRDALLWKICVL